MIKNVYLIITGNLNITNGTLLITGNGYLNVSGGFIFLENLAGNNLTIESGGQISG